VLLDSVIIIDQLNGVLRAEAYLEEVQHRAAISVITRAEVLVGYPDEEWSIAVDVLDSFPVLEIGATIAEVAARLRRDSRRLKLPDALQAAVAQHHGLQLATRNTRDFPPERFPFVVVPYRI
jgi:predicted nucleic acid-binding protein